MNKVIVYTIQYVINVEDSLRGEDVIEHLQETGAAEIVDVQIVNVDGGLANFVFKHKS